MKHIQEGTCTGKERKGKDDWHCQEYETLNGFHIQKVVKELGDADSNAVRKLCKSMGIV